MEIIRGEIVELIADEGKMLINKEGWTAHHVWLGCNDNIENWEEVDDIPEEEEVTPDGGAW